MPTAPAPFPGYPVSLYTLFVNRTTTTATAYPQLTLGDSLILSTPTRLTGFWLTTSMYQAAGLTTGAFLVIGRKQPVLSVSVSAQIVASHLNYLGAPARATWVSLADDPITVPSSTPISLYVVGSASVGDPLIAIASLNLRPL